MDALADESTLLIKAAGRCEGFDGTCYSVYQCLDLSDSWLGLYTVPVMPILCSIVLARVRLVGQHFVILSQPR